MPSLSDKLKALGLRVGTAGLTERPQNPQLTVEHVIPGRVAETDAGPVYLVEQFYSFDYQHSPKAKNQSLNLTAPREGIAQWAHEPRLAQDEVDRFAFLDTETSGLSGGTGTFAFLVGVGKYEKDHFHLAQFFMRDPNEESALLLALESFLAPCTVLVTFNGKAFDVPLLNTRYLLRGWESPLTDLAQIDLLHLARRIWRDRLPSRTLGNLEYQILGTERSNQEVPGWMIPQLYFDYLRSGDARPLQNVFYHNAMDVLSLATLLDHCAHLLAAPHQARPGEELEQVAMARIFEDLGEYERAIHLYQESLKKDLPDALYRDALRRLSLIYKRTNQKALAMELWEKAAQRGELYAYVEIAKVLEHERREFQQAIQWVEQALRILQSSAHTLPEQNQWRLELEHRLARLVEKRERHHRGTDDYKP